MRNESIESLNFCEETISKKHVLELAWLELCARLKEIRDGALYHGRWDSFEDFLTDPQMGMDKGTASKMIIIHERLILEYKIKPTVIANAGGWSKVAECMPAIKDKKSAEEWLSKASALSKSDLRKEVKDDKHPESISCKHKHTRKLILLVCKDCDYKEEYHE